MLEYSAFVQTYIPNMNNPDATFMSTVQSLAGDKKAYFGFGVLSPGPNSALKALGQILGKANSKK